MRIRNRLVGLILTTALATAPAVASPAGAFANDGEITTQEVATALKSIPGLLAQSDTIKSKSDSRAVITTTKSTSTSVPKDASTGVTVKGNSSSFTISLPNADINGTGKQVAPGVIAYSGEDGSTNAVQTNEDGSVRMLTVISSASAPTEYDYGITMPKGATLKLAGKEGWAAVVDKNGKPLMVIAPPWAKDASGRLVPTHFTTDGIRLTQVVEHNQSGIVYPVVADPYFKWYWNGVVVTLTRADMAAVMYGGTQALVPMLLVPGVGWSAIAGVLGMASMASWGYHNRQCAWFWLGVPGPSWGWYRC